MQESDSKNFSNRSGRKFKILLENEILRSIQKHKSVKYKCKSDKMNNFEQTFSSIPKLSKNNSQGTLFQYQYSTLFEDSHKKLSSRLLGKEMRVTNSAKKIRVTKGDLEKQKRVDSLEKLMKKCKEIKEDYKSTSVLSSYKKINHDLNKLKSSIEKIQENNGDASAKLVSEKLLRSDSKIIRSQLSYTEKLQKKHKSIWKYSTHSMNKRTERLIAAIDTKFKAKQILVV